MQIKQNLVSSSKYSIKCPYSMTPKYVTVHNTDNPNAAPAKNEVDYMISNDNQVSFHVAVDDVEAIQGIPFNRNAWAAGDGASGNGNRNSIHVEICKNKLGAGNATFKKAEANAVEVCAQLLKQFGLGIDRLKSHRDWNGKNCPSTTNFANFKDRVKKALEGGVDLNNPADNKYKNGTYKRKFIVKSPDGVLSVRDARPNGNTLGSKLGEFKNGDAITIGYILNNWGGVWFNGKQGFVNMEYVVNYEEKPNIPSTCKPWQNGDYNGADAIVRTGSGSNLNIRAGRPGLANYNKILGKLKDGQRVDVFYCLNGWFAVYINGVCNPGFISGDYIELI